MLSVARCRSLRRLGILLGIASLSLTGCAAFKQTVTIQSVPSGATVLYNGESQGMTPLQLRLSRNTIHHITLEKPFFIPQTLRIVPAPNERAENRLIFGLLFDTGYYHRFEPDIYTGKLTSQLLPRDYQGRSVELMSEKAVEADQLFHSGRLSREDHAVTIEQLVAFFHRR